MWYLLLSGVLGMLLGLFLLFFPLLLKTISQVTDRTVITVENGSYTSRLLTGLAQIVIGIWLIWTSRSYPGLWPLLQVGIVAIVFGLIFIFLPRFIDEVNHWGNTILFSDKEVSGGQRMVYGLLIILMSAYVLFVYFASR